MKTIVGLVIAFVSITIGSGCSSFCNRADSAQKEKTIMQEGNTCWETAFDQRLAFLGHRNWILVVDKAYPAQSGDGIEVINTGKPMKDVLVKVVDKLKAAPHVSPIYYTDKELGFMTEELTPGVSAYREDLKKILNGQTAHSLLHNDVFPKIDKAAKLFNVLILKTEATIAYSSVFIELDCGYWGPQQEAKLREIMK